MAAFWLRLAAATAAVEPRPPIFFKSLFGLQMVNFTIQGVILELSKLMAIAVAEFSLI
jgi:hypothetical protein